MTRKFLENFSGDQVPSPHASPGRFRHKSTALGEFAKSQPSWKSSPKVSRPGRVIQKSIALEEFAKSQPSLQGSSFQRQQRSPQRSPSDLQGYLAHKKRFSLSLTHTQHTLEHSRTLALAGAVPGEVDEHAGRPLSFQHTLSHTPSLTHSSFSRSRTVSLTLSPSHSLALSLSHSLHLPHCLYTLTFSRSLAGSVPGAGGSLSLSHSLILPHTLNACVCVCVCANVCVCVCVCV